MLEETENNKKVSKNEIELQAFRPSPNFRRILNDKFKGKVVTVEFKCGNFLKKATGCLNTMGPDFLELVGRHGKKVKIEIFRAFSSETIFEQAFKVLIPLKKVCSVEHKTPCDPCGPCND